MAKLIENASGRLQETVQALASKANSSLNKYLPPERRADLWAKVQRFIKEKPALASFILSQIVISGPVLVLFTTLTITVVLFSLITGLLIGLLGAVFFIVAAVGFALIFVLPTLFFTTMLAIFAWFWGIGIYYIIKNFNQKTTSDMHTNLKTGLIADSNGHAGGQSAASDHETWDTQRRDHPPKFETRSHENSHASGRDDNLVYRERPQV